MAAPFTSFKPREGRRGGDKSALASKYSHRPGQGPLLSVADPGRVPLTACPSLHINSKARKPSPSFSSSSSSSFHEGVAGKRKDHDSPQPVSSNSTSISSSSSSSSATTTTPITSSSSCLSAMYEARKRQKRRVAAEDSLAATVNDVHFASSRSIAAVTSAAMASKHALLGGSSMPALLTHGGSTEAKKQAWMKVRYFAKFLFAF